MRLLLRSLLLCLLQLQLPVSVYGAEICGSPQRIQVEVLGKIERSRRGFTQGLELMAGSFIESTGAVGDVTRLNRIEKSGDVRSFAEAPQRSIFGEGLTVLEGRVYQATWRDQSVFVFDAEGRLLRAIDIPYVGWGLTNDGANLILTDGSPLMRVLSPVDGTVVREIRVRLNDRPLFRVNELEWINGKVFGNVLGSSSIVRIDPNTGCVDGVYDASELESLLPDEEREYLRSDRNYVLNGIAYDGSEKVIYLTGKNWKYLFKVRMK